MRRRIVIGVAALVCVAAILVTGVVAMQVGQKEDPVVQIGVEPREPAAIDPSSQIRAGGADDAGRADASNPASTRDLNLDMPEPPIDVPFEWNPIESKADGLTTTWRYRVRGAAEDAARTLLPLLEASGASLVESGYLDMGGSAWGCVCSLPDDAGSLVITLLPARDADDDRDLEATIVMHEAPDWEEGSQ
ncbi:MAG: hypothetical protein ACOYIP_05270 [Coriobacteriales bacterium]|jgi:hypothetical protein